MADQTQTPASPQAPAPITQQVLINPQTGLAESFDPQTAQAKLQSGYEVPLHDAQGNPFSAPFAKAQQLVSQGTLREPTQNELEEWVQKGKYQTTSNKAMAAAEAAARGAFGPLATFAETGLGVNPQDIQNRERYNRDIALPTELGTMGALTAASFGLFGEARAGMAAATLPGLIGKAGEAASGAVKATGTFGTLAKAATMGAVESGLYEAQNQVSEKILGSPEATAEHMMASIGLSAALGGGFGIALTPITAGINKALGMSAGFLGRTQEAANPEAIDSWINASGMGTEERNTVLEKLKDLKPNVDEIDKAGSLLGVEPMEMQRSNSTFIQNLQQSILNEEGTWTGIKTAQRADKVFDGIKQGVTDALGETTDLTKNQIGGELKNGLMQTLSEEAKPINSLYQAVKETSGRVPIAPDALESVSQEIPNIEGLTTSAGVPISESSPGYQLANRVSGELAKGHLQNVDDLRLYMQRLGQDTIGQPELRYTAGQIRDKLENVLESSIVKTAKASGDPRFEQLLADYTNSKEVYSQFRDKLDTLGGVLGKKLRKGEGLSAFQDFLEGSTNEKIADKLFTKNNADFLSFLKENFPEQADLLGQMKRSQFRDMFDAHGSARTLSEINKLEPEIKQFLFRPEQLEKLKAADTLLSAFPKNINPSGTAKTLRLIDLFRHPAGLAVSEIASRAKKFLIESLVRTSPQDAPLISGMLGIHKIGTKTLIGIEKSAAGLLGYGDTQLRKPNYSSSELHPDEEKITQFTEDPDSLVDHLSQHTETMASYLPETTMGLSNVASRAISFLQSQRPNLQKNAPLDLDKSPSKSDIAKFNESHALLNDPMSIFAHVKNGSLNQNHMNLMKTVYPSVLTNMQKETMRNLEKYQSEDNPKPLPYRLKLGLSTLLGQNMDSSLNFLSANQSTLTGISMAQAATNQPPKASKSGMSKMKMSMRDETKAQQALERARA